MGSTKNFEASHHCQWLSVRIFSDMLQGFIMEIMANICKYMQMCLVPSYEAHIRGSKPATCSERNHLCRDKDRSLLPSISHETLAKPYQTYNYSS